MRSLSAQAWCMWTFFYSASNGYGRFQLDYKLILATAFRYYPVTPTEAEVYGWLREYKEKYLLFVYKAADGALWGAFDTRELTYASDLHISKADKKSPKPPKGQWLEWLSLVLPGRNSAAKRRAINIRNAGGHLSKKLREFIFNRDGRACQHCASASNLAVDHKLPVSRGGTNEENNLHTLCKPCNTAKRDRTWEEFTFASN